MTVMCVFVFSGGSSEPSMWIYHMIYPQLFTDLQRLEKRKKKGTDWKQIYSAFRKEIIDFFM